MPDAARVLIAGAGPVGLAAALRLAQLGVPVLVLERRMQLGRVQHASAWLPPTLEVFEQLGILDGALRTGLAVRHLAFRRAGQEAPVARFDFRLLAGETRFPFRLHLDQGAVAAALAAQLTAYPHVRLAFGAEVVQVRQDEAGVAVGVHGALGERLERGAALLAADGAASTVRGMLGIGLQGGRPAGLVADLSIAADLGALVPDAACAWIHAPCGWCALLRMPDLWHVSLPLAAGATEAALEPAALRARLARFLPLGAGALPVLARELRAVRRQVAGAYGSGRVLLAGDAAHQADTRAGLNMNCGLHDAMQAAEALAVAWHRPAAAPAALADYAQARRLVATAQLLPFADRAAPWLGEPGDGTASGGEAGLAEIAAIAADPGRARAWLRAACMLDMPGFRAPAMAAGLPA